MSSRGGEAAAQAVLLTLQSRYSARPAAPNRAHQAPMSNEVDVRYCGLGGWAEADYYDSQSRLAHLKRISLGLDRSQNVATPSYSRPPNVHSCSRLP